MMEMDDKYNHLRRERADASMALKEALDIRADILFEEYSDTVYAQEAYELDAIYRQAFLDVLELLEEQGLV